MCGRSKILAGLDIVRAWKDEGFRASLSDAERAVLPAAPAGLLELDDSALDGIASGARSAGTCGCGGCTCHCRMN